jgi:hypothetical protein
MTTKGQLHLQKNPFRLTVVGFSIRLGSAIIVLSRIKEEYRNNWENLAD